MKPTIYHVIATVSGVGRIIRVHPSPPVLVDQYNDVSYPKYLRYPSVGGGGH